MHGIMVRWWCAAEANGIGTNFPSGGRPGPNAERWIFQFCALLDPSIGIYIHFIHRVMAFRKRGLACVCCVRVATNGHLIILRILRHGLGGRAERKGLKI